MGLSNSIFRLKGYNLSTTDLNDYSFIFISKEREELVYFNKCNWIDGLFNFICNYGRQDDNFVVTRECLEQIVNGFKEYLDNGSSNDNHIQGTLKCEETEDIKEALQKLAPILDEDFVNDTIYFNRCG